MRHQQKKGKDAAPGTSRERGLDTQRLPGVPPHLQASAKRRSRSLPSRNHLSPWCWGLIGPKAEAEEIKTKLAAFLRETLALELNTAKTLITHARTGAARFLGYQITVQHSSTKITNGRRSVNGRIALRVPGDVVTAQCARYRRRGKPWHRSILQNLTDYDIVQTYGAEYRGVANYYLLAQDVWRLNRLRWNAETSMLKTLAAKHKSTVTKMAARHKAKVITDDGPPDLL